MADNSVEHKYNWKNVGNQYIAILTVSLMNICAGFANGWMAPMIPILRASDGPMIAGPLTNEEISWVSAFFSIGCMTGSFFFTCLTAFIGSKYSTTFIIIPSIAFSLTTYFGNTFVHMLIGRIVAGIVMGATQSAIVIYTSEIVNDNIRGRFSSCGPLCRNIGVLFCFLIGSYIGYEHMSTANLIMSFAFLAIFSFLPNTPQFYLQRQQYKNAEKALKFYKGFKGANEEETTAFAAELERIKLLAEQVKDDKNLKFADLCNKPAMWGLFVAGVLTTLVNVTGNKAASNYAIPMFKEASPQLDTDISTILLACMHILGCLGSTQFADILGRKCLLIVSLIGCTLGLVAFSVYSYLSDLGFDVSSFQWFPVAVILFSNLMGSLGVTPLASLCAVESLPPKIRGFGLAMSLIIMNVVSFASLKTFPIWMEAIGLSFTFLIYAVGCALGAIFVFAFVIEMTGKRIDDMTSKN